VFVSTVNYVETTSVRQSVRLSLSIRKLSVCPNFMNFGTSVLY